VKGMRVMYVGMSNSFCTRPAPKPAGRVYRSRAALFNHLICPPQEELPDPQAQRCRGLEVDQQLETSWAVRTGDRPFWPVENPIDIARLVTSASSSAYDINPPASTNHDPDTTPIAGSSPRTLRTGDGKR